MEQLTFHTESRVINDLIPYEKNPRKLDEKQFRQLKASLEKFNLAEIPVIDTDNKIVAGHQRLMVLKSMGRGNETIDVRVPNRKMTEEEFKEYLVRSNKNTGSWDYDLLASDFEVEDLVMWGFDDKELGLDERINDLADGDLDEEKEQAGIGKQNDSEIICPNCQYKFEK